MSRRRSQTTNWWSRRKKHWKDVKSINIWHASPERLSILRPRSHFAKMGGLFFSPSYRSLVWDWAPFVLGKKDKTHPLEQRWDELWDEYNHLSRETPEGKARLAEIDSQIDKVRDRIGGESHYRRPSRRYKTVFVHRIAAPDWVVDEARECMRRVYNATPNNKINFGFWFWGAQIFVEAHNLRQLRITSVKAFSRKGIDKEIGLKAENYRDETKGFPEWESFLEPEN